MGSPVDSPPHLFEDVDMSGERNKDENVIPSSDVSQPGSGGPSSAGGGRPKEKKRVGFTYDGADSGSRSPMALSPPKSGHASPDSGSNTPQQHSRTNSVEMMMPRSISKSHLPELSPQQTKEIHEAFGSTLPVPKPRPAIRRASSAHPDLADEEVEGPDELGQRAIRQRRMKEAFERAKRLEEDERSQPPSRVPSPERGARRNTHSDAIPLQDLPTKHEDDTDEDEDGLEMPKIKRSRALFHHEAHDLVRKHTQAHKHDQDDSPSASGYRSGAVTPTEEQDFMQDYRPRPSEYRGGILSTLLKLYNHEERTPGHSRSSSVTRLPLMSRHRRMDSNDTSATPTPQHSPPESGTVTPNGGSPKGWFNRKHKTQSTTSLGKLIGQSASLGTPVMSGLGEQVSARLKEVEEQEQRSGLGKRTASSNAIAALNRVTRHQRRNEDEIRITIHIAETIARQRYLMRLCRALMMYGAPTHRLEEYMRMSARVLEIEAQFLYIPGSMLMSFDDASTHTTEVKLVKTAQGLDLGKLRDVHEVYKEVVHDRIGVEEATNRLKEVMSKKVKHSRWIRIPVYGLAAVCVGPFAFEARLIDLPICFILGCILGILQLVIAPISDLYSNVFEISSAVITSFLARAFGSIPDSKGGRLFCFSALAQSSIALILPGYIVLCASLELQSKSIVAGSVRMVYAIIYSLFLGFGITIGTAIYGLCDKNASSETTCANPLSHYWFFFFVPGFTLCLIVINQAKWKQAPIMMVIAFTGYIVNYFSAKRFAGNTQVSNTLGALAIGVMANFYSRTGSIIENWALDRWEDDLRPVWKRFRKYILRHKSKEGPKKLEEGVANDNESIFVRSTRRVGYSLAAAAMLPAIFVQVPSGLSVQGSLVQGLTSANQIAGNATNGSTVANQTTLSASDGGLNSIAFNVGYSVVQVAIGITVGLFLSAIVVYPLGKRRSGLFSL